MSIHGIFSLGLLLIALFLVFKLWYPTPLDKAMGVTHVFWVLLAIDLILGPLLTFVIFNPKKKELKIDLLIIIMIQLSAYFYGLYSVAQGRPVFQVFVVDDIELVRAIDLQGKKSIYSSGLLLKPQWVAATYSENPIVANKQKQAEIFEGISIATRPEAFIPLDSRKKQILSKLKKIDILKQFNSLEEVEFVLKEYSNRKIIGYLPVKAYYVDMVVFFDKNVNPVAIVNLRPWSVN